MTTQAERTRERVWAAHGELLAVGAAGPSDYRAVLRIGSMIGADLGVDHPWGLQVTAGLHPPDAGTAATALGWCRERDRGHGWRVSVPADHVGREPWADLVEADSMTMWATDPGTAARLPLRTPSGVELVRDPTLAEVHAAYGGWMADAPLAQRLVLASDLERPDRRFVVARLDGRPVGCAFIWWAAGTAYLSGIGVVEELRGHGIGNALTAAAAHLGAQGVSTQSPEVVWMLATSDGAALYSRMGFVKVDTEAQLGPR